jgi:DNA repair exonuclease SbcCD ATPase subunit
MVAAEEAKNAQNQHQVDALAFAAARAELDQQNALLRAQLAQALQGLQRTGVGVSVPSGSGRVDGRTQGNDALGTALELIDVQARQLEQADAQLDALNKALEDANKRAASLEKAIEHQPEERDHAAGVSYGSSGSMGVWYEYNMGRIVVGVEVERHPVGTTSTNEIEAKAKIGWRF